MQHRGQSKIEQDAIAKRDRDIERASGVERCLRAYIGEHLDGFILLGFEAGSNTPIVSADAKDAKTFMALDSLLFKFTHNKEDYGLGDD